MADATSTIFNKKAAEKLRSPDDLDKYLRVTNPSVWILLLACIALIIGLVIWGFFGTVSSSVTTKAVVQDNQALCFLSNEDVARVYEGNPVNINGSIFEVATVAETPSSREEARQVLANDYLVSTILSDDWGYVVTLQGDTSHLPVNVPLDARITTESVAPISLIFNV